jgi:predicted amidophosphoribosyltransferase
LQCGTDQLEKQDVLCRPCINKLPYTDFENEWNNPIHKIFWGRVSFCYANALLFFTKESIVQLLITELKYQQNKKAAEKLELENTVKIEKKENILMDYITLIIMEIIMISKIMNFKRENFKM